MSETPDLPHTLKPDRSELRNSFVLPVAITMAIWIVGIIVFIIFPTQFVPVISLLIGLSLLVYLWTWTRNARFNLRVMALVFAIPALIGMTLGMVRGSLRETMLGFGITFLLLTIQRILNTPLSFRIATRHFRNGNPEEAMHIVSKSIESRPDFWQSYQLRALLHLMNMHFSHAERDAKKAIALNPQAHPVYNTLGQIYLAQNQFVEAEESYWTAVHYDPSNALYLYHLGLSSYRQEKYQQAAEAFAAASRSTLPYPEYDLLNQYYLGHSLQQIDQPQLAEETFAVMTKFGNSLQDLQTEYESLPDYPHKNLLKADLEVIADLLAQQEKDEA